MKYYLHSTSYIEDEKVAELYIEHGYEGVGLFYVLQEKLSKHEKPMKTTVLKHQLKVGKKLEKIWKFLEEIELISSNNGETFCEESLNNTEIFKDKNEKTKIRVAKFRENQRLKKEVTRNDTQSNAPKETELELTKPKLDIINNISVELRSTYDNLPKTKESIFEFIKTNKPLFIEPYIEYWNIFADAYSMAKVKTLTEKRKKKLLVRLKEESFSFTKILIKLSVASDFVLTKKWLTFDWIIESQANYVKILEGNYDKVKSDTENDKTVSSNSPQYKSFDERS
jgi:hypothetical protein